MEKILQAPETEAPEVTPEESTTEITPEVTEEVDETSSDDSSSQEVDYDKLIEEERSGGKPDPVKARERFEKSRNQPEPTEQELDVDLDDEDRPMTRREAREFLAQQSHQTLVESNTERIMDYSEAIADSPAEAAYIREIHKNRVFPANMSLREQIAEAHAVATYKRTQSKAAELARAVRSAETKSHNSAASHRDPQASPAPKLGADLTASLKRSGYTYNNQNQRYEKTLPNGKTLWTKDGKNPQVA